MSREGYVLLNNSTTQATTIIRVDVIIKDAKLHKTIDGTQLTIAREQLGLTQSEFADRCFWSQQYQSKLESAREQEVSIDIAMRIIRILG